MNTQVNVLTLAPQQVSLDVLEEKYCKGSERTSIEIFDRTADALSKAEKDPSQWLPAFRKAFDDGFVGAGRIMATAGTGIQATLINCFVQPIGDAISGTCPVTKKPGIYDALRQATETMRRGGGVGYNFSAIRPRNAKVRGTASFASGPISYMQVFDASCGTVESAGSRRGAQMGVLRIDHPDILEFVDAKTKKSQLTNFNISIGVTDAFMRAMLNDEAFELVHAAEPSDDLIAKGAYQHADGQWVYQAIDSRSLWDLVMRTTYDYSEPGILFIDRMNLENNLYYVETIEATNPCGEQPLPDYGCCDLGPIILTRLIRNPFTDRVSIDWEKLAELVKIGVRMLDNVLDVTFWPLPEQEAEAQSKRRIGLGYTGLGDALIMMNLAYNTQEARDMAAKISEFIRDEAYMASVELAKEKGAFPLFDADKYLQSGFAKRLPSEIREAIATYGIRNSHLLSIAPVGTVSLAFADNASNGVEPPFALSYTRKKRMADGSTQEYAVEDHAFRVYRALGLDVDNLPGSFVTATQIEAADHIAMLAAVQPFIDTSISKTVNVAEDYPYESFKDIYLSAWKAGLKGAATYRPSDVRGAVLVIDAPKKEEVQKTDFDETDPDRRIRLEKLPETPLASLRWQKRPKVKGGNPAWTYMVEHPTGADFAVFVGHFVNGSNHPFEVWVNGGEQPRGLGALAKSLSMDMRCDDRAWLKAKLDSLKKVKADDGFQMELPDGSTAWMPSTVAAFATLLEHRCEELGAFAEDKMSHSPVLNALMSRKEPKAGPDGTLGWSVDIKNSATDDDFCMYLKELVLPNGQRRPYSVWMDGDVPETLKGLCKSLSFDLRVVDPAWVGAKLRQLLSYSEPQGHFFARVPGSEKSEVYPSTVAYVARLIIHRFAMLGILDEEGFPVEDMGVFVDDSATAVESAKPTNSITIGKLCKTCNVKAVIKRDGCNFCTNCGEVGSCG